MPMFLLINIGGHRVVWNASKTFQYCLKDYLRATARYSHANLLAHTFLVSFKHKIIRESLKPCTFSVSQRTRFCPVINVCSSAPAPGNCICGFVWVEPFVNLADFCAGNIQLQIFGGSVKSYAQICFGIWQKSITGGRLNRPLVTLQQAGRKGSRAAVRRSSCP